MLKNYKELKVWKKSYALSYLETQILLAGDLNYAAVGNLEELKRNISEIERMLKALIRSLENKPSAP